MFLEADPERGRETVTRKEQKVIEGKILECVRKRNFEAFKDILTSELGIPVGSERFRSLESEFWRAVALMEQRRKQQP